MMVTFLDEPSHIRKGPYTTGPRNWALSVGLAVFLGGFPAAATTAVGADRAVADPSAFVAVTATRMVCPASAPTSVYVLSVPLETFTQLPPLVLQRIHR